MTSRRTLGSLVLAILSALPLPVRAQQAQETSAQRATGWVFGPLTVGPRLDIDNLGVDTNVFNAAGNPTRDLTATLRPGLLSQLRMGRTLVTAKSGLELIYYRKSPGQRSSGYEQDVEFRAPLTRVTPFVSVGRRRTHQRPNFEIDERIEQASQSMKAGADITLGSALRLTTQAIRTESSFGDPGNDIGIALDRESQRFSTELGVVLTPLTTFVARVDRSQDRFARNPLRDSDVVAVNGGFQLKPAALVSGTVEVGYRRVTPLNKTVPEFGGLVAAIQTVYLFRESTRIGVDLSRTVEYSIEDREPYYVTLGGAASLMQGIGRRWDVVFGYGRTLMSYQAVLDSFGKPTDLTGRRDRQLLYRTGVGFRVTPTIRAGVDVNYGRRLSPEVSRQYDGYRFGGSFNYAY